MLMLKRYDATQKILGSQEALCSLEALMALREAYAHKGSLSWYRVTN